MIYQMLSIVLGVDFGEAYEIPDNLQGVPFHAAVVLKVYTMV